MITWDVPDQSWEQFPALHKRFAVSETMAHLEFMRWEGRVEKADGNDGVVWSSIKK